MERTNDQTNTTMKNSKFTIPTNKNWAAGQVFVDVTPKEVYDYLDSLDENDIVERTKYDFSI